MYLTGAPPFPRRSVSRLGRLSVDDPKGLGRLRGLGQGGEKLCASLSSSFSRTSPMSFSALPFTRLRVGFSQRLKRWLMSGAIGL